jgi:superfamily II DNA helicase RecQ
MANTPAMPSSQETIDLAPVLAQLRRIAAILDDRLPAAAASTAAAPAPAVALKGGQAPVPLDEAGERVFQALRAWRLERARADGLSPYIVAYDRALRLVAREKPTDVQSLGGLLGPNKAKKYGEELLAVLAKV